MNKEKAINILKKILKKKREVIDFWKTNKDLIIYIKDKLEEPKEEVKAYEMAIKALENERPKGKWIPVSEKLPEKNMPCLVSVGKLIYVLIIMYALGLMIMEKIDDMRTKK